MKPYYFVGPKFTIALSSNAPAAFGFKIIWLPCKLKYASYFSIFFLVPNIDIGYSGVTEAAEVLNATGIIYKQSIYSRGGIHLLPFPQDPTNYFSLRSALVFEGGSFPGCNYVGK